MYPPKIVITTKAVLRLLGVVLLGVFLLSILPGYIVQQNRYHNWQLMFKNRRYTKANDVTPYPSHPYILQVQAFIDKMGDMPERNTSTVNQMIDNSQGLSLTFEGLSFGSGVDLFYLLYWMEEYELEEVLLSQWRTTLLTRGESSALTKYSTTGYNLGDYDYQVSSIVYMDMCEAFLNVIQYRLAQKQFDEAIELTGQIRESLQILDPDPRNFMGSRSTFNSILLLDMIYQNAWLVRTYPDDFQRLEKVLANGIYQINDIDPSEYPHPELTYLDAYIVGLSHYYQRQYITAIDQFSFAENTLINTPLKELARLMQVRSYYQQANITTSVDSIEMWIDKMRRVKQRISYDNYENDSDYYLAQLNGKLQQSVLGQVDKSTPPGEGGVPSIPGIQDRPITRRDLIKILQAMLTILQDEN